MGKNQDLCALLKSYISEAEGLAATREYVTLHLGAVPNDLVDHVSMEIWHFEDGLIEEKELRHRLAAILDEFGQPTRYFYGFEIIPEITSSTGASITGRYDRKWSIHDSPTFIHGGTHQFV